MATTIVFRHGYASLKLHIWDGGRTSISNVYSRKPGHGDGTKAMRKLIKYADKNGLVLFLMAEPYGILVKHDVDRLERFYKRFGFKVYSRTPNPWMYRRPSQKKQVV